MSLVFTRKENKAVSIDSSLGAFSQRLISCSILIVSLSFSGFAAANIWHVNAKIKSVYPESNGNFVLIFNQDHGDCLSTVNPDFYRVSVGQNSMTVEGAEKIFAAALSAASTGTPVSIYFDETNSNCHINRLRINF